MGLFNKKNSNTEKNSKNNAKPAKTKFQKKKLRRKIINSIMGFIVFCGLLGVVSGFNIVKLILSKTDVVLETEDLTSQDASLIFDDAGNQIMILGKESRISYAYNKFPQVLVDAFIAVEDSRFFEHPGFDLPRFAKAFLENVKTLSFAQGGSTITMQVIKNTYFAVDTIAESTINRKVQEIYYALQISNLISKEKVFEMYINKVNFGANARGVQVASQYYFYKDCTDLNLVESAMLAGIINAPNTYNPYYDIEACQQRTADVLYLMNYHGYITDLEYELALKVRVEDLLYGNTLNNPNVITEYVDGTIDNQAYIDVVLAELEEMYGIDPYTTPVRVYTAMNQTVQATCDALSRGEIIAFKDNNINVASAVIQNFTGLIVGVCGGRNYNGQRIFNYAYDARVSPGSTSKAMFTYPLAFEHCGMSTSFTIDDEPTLYAGTNVLFYNDSRTWNGETSVQKTFPLSYNVPSIKLYRWIEETVGTSVMRKYLKNIGYDQEMIDFMNEQYAIGCFGYDISPIQMAATQAVILSKGVYVTPHTITRIEFINSSKEPIIANVPTVRALSEGAAWLTSYLEYIGIYGGTEDDYEGNMRLTAIRRSNYAVYGKTGTNGYDISVIRKWGYPVGSDKDLLYLFGTNDYSFSFWMGYDTGRYQDKTTYMSYAYAHSMKDVPAVNALLNAVYNAFGAPKNTNSRPSSVASITHIKGLYPYTALPEYADKKLQTTGYVLAQFANLEEYKPEESIENVQSFTAKYDDQNYELQIQFSPYSDPQALKIAPRVYKEKRLGIWYNAVRRFHKSWIEGCVEYVVEIYNPNTGEVFEFVSDKDTFICEFKNTTEEITEFKVNGYYRYSITKVRCDGLTVGVEIKPYVEEEPVDPGDGTDPGTPPGGGQGSGSGDGTNP
ncbi:MAG: transglycosylase domain-containing protein [Erysipelotrichaceae bacterium]|jgi:penicillin-binding protein 1A